MAEATPQFGHLPVVTGEGNRKLSKRDPESNLFVHRDRGFLPEGLLNYLALLGWAIGEDRDVFTPAELVEAFDVSRVSANPARFDLRKAEAINAAHLRGLAPDEFVTRVLPYLARAGLVDEPAGTDTLATLRAIAGALEAAPEWTAQAIEQALKAALVDGLGVKPRKVFAPVRVGVTGRTVSPPLYESMELLGRDRSVQRLRTALECGREG